jgi:hypothetical protein
MMPHLGVLSTVYSEAAWSIFDKDCLIRLGTVIAASGLAKEGDHVMDFTIAMPDGRGIREEMKFGEIKRITLQEGEEAEILISPRKGFDVGAGSGHHLETKVSGGLVGLIIDARGRPLILPEDKQVRQRKLMEWITALELYPEDMIKELL